MRGGAFLKGKEGRVGFRKKLLHNIPIIPPRIPTYLPDFSVIQFMKTHMIVSIRYHLILQISI